MITSDAFAGWNLISSFGSIVSVIAAGLFLYIVYKQLLGNSPASRYPWLSPQYFTDVLQALLNRNYPSLEWALTSPTKTSCIRKSSFTIKYNKFILIK